MIEKLQTEVAITRPDGFRISHHDRIVLIGSCFADEMGVRFLNSGFKVTLNPFGTLYNPASIYNSVKRLTFPEEFTVKDIVRSGELYCSFFHHGSFSDISPERFLERANSSLISAASAFSEATVLVLTFGTARVYVNRDRNMIVSNCHKLPARDFEERMMSVDECTSLIEGTVKMALETGIKKIVLTVSPIRHLKDGLHANALSKAALLIAVENVCRKHECCTYFPAYEILMDELRDYRFYADDLCHPSSKTAGYIWKRFGDFCMDDETISLVRDVEALRAGFAHRAMFPESESWAKFRSNLERRKADLIEKHPEVDIHFCNIN